MWDTKKITIAIVLVLLAGGSWWLSRGVAPPAAEHNLEARHDPDYIIENFSATVMNELGRRRYILHARKLVHYFDDDTSELEQPYLIQFQDGTAPIHARSNHGWLSSGASEIVMTGAVHVARNRDPRDAGAQVTTDKLTIELDK